MNSFQRIHIAAMRTILSLSLALISVSAPAAAFLGWRLSDPITGTPGETTSTDSDRKVVMAENGYTLVSSTVANGLTIDIWSPVSETIAKRSPLLPASLPGAKGGLLTPSKREPSLSPSALRRRDSVGATALEKRDAIDIQGRKCSTACGFQNWQHADTNDCASAYEQLYSIPGTFTLVPKQALSATSNNKTCSIWTVNHSSSNITYDHWDAAGTGQWLNGACLMNQGATVGVCLYEGIGSNITNGVYTAVCHPTYMTGM